MTELRFNYMPNTGRRLLYREVGATIVAVTLSALLLVYLLHRNGLALSDIDSLAFALLGIPYAVGVLFAIGRALRHGLERNPQLVIDRDHVAAIFASVNTITSSRVTAVSIHRNGRIDFEIPDGLWLKVDGTLFEDAEAIQIATAAASFLNVPLFEVSRPVLRKHRHQLTAPNRPAEVG